MPSSRSNGCADSVIIFATFSSPYCRRLYCPVMPYLLDERLSCRLGSVKNAFRTKYFRRTNRKTPARRNLLQTSSPDADGGVRNPREAGCRPRYHTARRSRPKERGSVTSCVPHAKRLRRFASLSPRGTSGERAGERGN